MSTGSLLQVTSLMSKLSPCSGDPEANKDILLVVRLDVSVAVDAYRVDNNPLISLKQKLLDPVYAKLYKIHPLLHPD